MCSSFREFSSLVRTRISSRSLNRSKQNTLNCKVWIHLLLPDVSEHLPLAPPHYLLQHLLLQPPLPRHARHVSSKNKGLSEAAQGPFHASIHLLGLMVSFPLQVGSTCCCIWQQARKRNPRRRCLIGDVIIHPHYSFSIRSFSRCVQVPHTLQKNLNRLDAHASTSPSTSPPANQTQRNAHEIPPIPKPSERTSATPPARLGASSVSPQWLLKCEIKIEEDVNVCVPVEQRVNMKPEGAIMSPPGTAKLS